MNILKSVSLAALVATGLMGSGIASAAQICVGCNYRFVGDAGLGTPAVAAASYIGSYDPTAGGILPGSSGDSGSFTHGGLGLGTFEDWWIWEINPAGGGEWDATFNPGLSVTNFKVEVYSLTGITVGGGLGDTCTDTSAFIAPGDRVAGVCSSTGVIGALIGSNGPGSELRVSGLVFPVGFYGAKVTGNVISGSDRFYSGNLSTTPIPEPGSLALVAIGLLAAGAGLRRRA